MLKKIFLFVGIVLLISGCGLAKPTVSNKSFIKESNYKLLYLLVTDEYAVNKGVKPLLENYLKSYYRTRLHSDVVQINNKSEIKNKDSVLIDVQIDSAENHTIFVTYKAYDNKTNNLLFQYDKLGKTKWGWAKVSKHLAENMSKLAMEEFSIRNK